VHRYNAYTSIRLVPRTTEFDYIVFKRSDGSCNSAIGRSGGPQTINLDGRGFCSPAATAHEVGHAIGLYHTQSRADRDSFVTMNFSNVQSGKEHNFNKYSTGCIDCGRDIFSYDYGSVMHYGQRDFSSNGLNTIDLNATAFAEYVALYGPTTPGSQTGFSKLDTAVLKFLYDTCNDNPPPSTLSLASIWIPAKAVLLRC
jgi:hypothetical protein